MKTAFAMLVVAAFASYPAAAAAAPAACPLPAGASLPDVQVRTVEDDAVSLRDLATRQPTVLIFYRGGWCPYCNTHLHRLQEIEPALKERGFQILAVSPDRPAALRESVDNEDISYTLLSDSSMAAAKAFGLAFQLDDATLETYAEYGISLEEASGQSHHMLPVPAVYLVDSSGTIVFQHYNEDYTQRLAPGVVLAAAEALLEQEKDRASAAE